MKDGTEHGDLVVGFGARVRLWAWAPAAASGACSRGLVLPLWVTTGGGLLLSLLQRTGGHSTLLT